MVESEAGFFSRRSDPVFSSSRMLDPYTVFSIRSHPDPAFYTGCPNEHAYAKFKGSSSRKRSLFSRVFKLDYFFI